MRFRGAVRGANRCGARAPVLTVFNRRLEVPCTRVPLIMSWRERSAKDLGFRMANPILGRDLVS